MAGNVDAETLDAMLIKFIQLEEYDDIDDILRPGSVIVDNQEGNIYIFSIKINGTTYFKVGIIRDPVKKSIMDKADPFMKDAEIDETGRFRVACIKAARTEIANVMLDELKMEAVDGTDWYLAKQDLSEMALFNKIKQICHKD